MSSFAAALPEVRQLVLQCCGWLVACGGTGCSPAMSELGVSQGVHHTQLPALVA